MNDSLHYPSGHLNHILFKIRNSVFEIHFMIVIIFKECILIKPVIAFLLIILPFL